MRHLTEAEEVFVLEYLRDHNGTRAYFAAHPNCKSVKAAATGAYGTLRRPLVRRRLEAAAEAQHTRLQMQADEALMLISQDARADAAQLFDDKDQILPIHLWPESVRRSVKRIRQTAEGLDVTLNDSLKARELMAIAGGKLKTVVKHEFDLGKYLGAEPPPADEP